MKEPDMGAEIMQERLTWAIEMVKHLAKQNGIVFNEAICLWYSEIFAFAFLIFSLLINTVLDISASFFFVLTISCLISSNFLSPSSPAID